MRTININYIRDKNINYSNRRKQKPVVIVNHISQGSKESCISWFKSKNNNNSSTHFLVGRDGSIYQFVKIEDAAWGNGLYLEDIKNAFSSVVRSKYINPNLYTVSIEHEGIYEKSKGSLTKKQLNSTIFLHRYIINYIKNKYKYSIPINRKHIIGHYEIDPNRKPYCPGEKFPFDKIIEKLKKDQSFKDIENHWAEKAILNVTNKNIMEGYPDGNFRPEEYIKRGELASIINKLIKI